MLVVELLTLLDGKILQFFTKLCHGLQVLTGRTNFFLAKQCLFLGLVAPMFLVSINYWIPILSQETEMWAIALSGGSMVFYFLQAGELDREEQRLLNSGSDASLLNPKANGPISLLRPLLLVALLITQVWIWITKIQETALFFDKIYKFLPWFILVLMYLEAVTPLPPGKIKEIRASLSTGFRELVPVTRPQK